MSKEPQIPRLSKDRVRGGPRVKPWGIPGVRGQEKEEQGGGMARSFLGETG